MQRQLTLSVHGAVGVGVLAATSSPVARVAPIPRPTLTHPKAARLRGSASWSSWSFAGDRPTETGDRLDLKLNVRGHLAQVDSRMAMKCPHCSVAVHTDFK